MPYPCVVAETLHHQTARPCAEEAAELVGQQQGQALHGTLRELTYDLRDAQSRAAGGFLAYFKGRLQAFGQKQQTAVTKALLTSKGDGSVML